jgi:O-antigen/teichoic acid export membrane protein
LTASATLSLRDRVLRAGGWSAAGYALSQVIRLASNLVMTRLLAPESFGIMAIAVMVVTVLSLLSDVGLQQSVMRSGRGEEPGFLDSAWVVQIIRGAVLWITALAASGALHAAALLGAFPAGSVYADPALPWVIAATSFSAVVLGFQSMRLAVAQRRFDQRLFVRIEILGQLAGFAVALAACLAEPSIWGLVAGWLAAAAVQVTLGHMLTEGPRHRMRVDVACLRELMGFGKWVFGSSAAYVLATSGDRILLGGLVSTEVLGMYAIAHLIVGAVEAGCYRLFGSISMPALSEIARRDATRMREAYYRLRLPGDALLLFACGFLLAAGTWVIDVLYDARYAPSGEMLSALSLSFFVARFGVAHQVYLAIGKPALLLAINSVRLASLLVLVPLAFHLAGPTAAVWAVALHSFSTLPLVGWFNSRLGLNDVRKEFVLLGILPAGYAFGVAMAALGGRG